MIRRMLGLLICLIGFCLIIAIIEIESPIWQFVSIMSGGALMLAGVLVADSDSEIIDN